MTLTKLTAVLLVVLLVATGVTAALPGNAPADSNASDAGDHPADEAGDTPAEHADDGLNQLDHARENDDAAVRGPTMDADGDVDSSAADNASEVPGDVPQSVVPERAPAGADASAQGPPVDLPAQVPDFVSELHQLIRDVHSGDLTGSLGDAFSSVTPGDADEDAGNESQQGMPTGAPAA